MWFTINKKSRTTNKVVRCITHHKWCTNRNEAIKIASEVYNISGSWMDGYCLTMFPSGESAYYYTLSFRKK